MRPASWYAGGQQAKSSLEFHSPSAKHHCFGWQRIAGAHAIPTARSGDPRSTSRLTSYFINVAFSHSLRLLSPQVLANRRAWSIKRRAAIGSPLAREARTITAIPSGMSWE